MEQNSNLNIANLQQILNSQNFAQFLAQHLSHNNVSQREISNLLNIFSNQLNIQNPQDNNYNNNANNSFRESEISHISFSSNNHSIISD